MPDFPGYFALEDGSIVSYKRGKRILLTLHPQEDRYDKSGRRRASRRPLFNGNVRKTHYDHTIVLAAKLGRWLEPWEEVRHKDGDWRNNRMDNLEPGDHLNNIIDDLEIGKRETSLEYLDEAIARLMDLRAEIEQEKSPTD